ncbi:MAG: LTA synthase family protein [Salinivirgaceae bacterium]
MIRARLLLFVKTGIFWMLFFLLSRTFFLLYNWEHTFQLPLKDIAGSILHGLKLDSSLTGYLLFFLALILALSTFASGKLIKPIVKTYQWIFLLLFTLLTVVDAELYKNWGFRIDNTVLLYLKTPKESLASTQLWLIVLLIIVFAVLSYFSIKIYQKYIGASAKKILPAKWYNFPLFLLLAGVMIIPIRGGLGIAPINVGAVFFSKQDFANHAAVNVGWNFGKSLTEMNQIELPEFYEQQEAKNTVQQLLASNGGNKQQFLRNDSASVLIIILESFTGKVIAPLGGNTLATPNFTALAEEGVLFDRIFATGDRSDKGIVGILSGYPAQPTTSIIKYTSKSEKLPQLSRFFKAHNYQSAFYYGGDINFANMNSYFVSGAYDKLVTQNNFDVSQRTTKWGVHDHWVFEKLQKDLSQTKQPFFTVMFTLSSHDPFDVPHKSNFTGSDWDNRYLNAIHYTDSCLGAFIETAKKSDWWENTLVVLVADHGSKYQQLAYSSPEKFHIPMLWLGGVLNQTDTVISSTCSQIDIPVMISNQLNKNYSGAYFAKDVLSGQEPFAYYAFNNGFGFLNDSTHFVWDLDLGDFILNKEVSSQVSKQGKSFVQEVLIDFSNK